MALQWEDANMGPQINKALFWTNFGCRRKRGTKRPSALGSRAHLYRLGFSVHTFGSNLGLPVPSSIDYDRSIASTSICGCALFVVENAEAPATQTKQPMHAVLDLGCPIGSLAFSLALMPFLLQRVVEQFRSLLHHASDSCRSITDID